MDTFSCSHQRTRVHTHTHTLTHENVSIHIPECFHRKFITVILIMIAQEDTLACILALDGFFLDGRNVRASYGTSKYCSAFIKNVRCNNPECTYLHSMGDAEDTFTKQEIQAGYVTSGRDVLARQQKLLAGSARRKTGGGGPSGTGRSSVHPVFPPPTYDDSSKSSATSLVPNPNGILRSVSTAAGYPGASSTGVPAVPLASKVHSASGSTTAAVVAAGGAAGAAGRRTSAGAVAGLSVGNAPVAATAASVVAGMHTLGTSTSSESQERTALTQLTPLKRSQSKAKTHTQPQAQPGIIPAPTPSFSEADPPLPAAKNPNGLKLTGLRKGNTSTAAGANGTVPTSPSSSSISSSNGSLIASKLASDSKDFSVGSLGGSVVTNPLPSASLGAIGSNAKRRNNDNKDNAKSSDNSTTSSSSSVKPPRPVGLLASLGGEILVPDTDGGNSSKKGNKNKDRSKAIAGAPGSKWDTSGIREHSNVIGGSEIWGLSSAPKPPTTNISGGPTTLGGGGLSSIIGGGPTSLIGGNNTHNNHNIGPGAVGGHGVIGGGMRLGGGPGMASPMSSSIGSSSNGPGGANNMANSNNGSSALASLLGINLPTGSASLSHSPSLWNQQNPQFQPQQFHQQQQQQQLQRHQQQQQQHHNQQSLQQQSSTLSALYGNGNGRGPVGVGANTNNLDVGGHGLIGAIGSKPPQSVPIGAPMWNSNNGVPGAVSRQGSFGGPRAGAGNVPAISRSNSIGSTGGNSVGGGGTGNKGDMALLQSLLPGVQITSGEQQTASHQNGGWRAGDHPVPFGASTAGAGGLPGSNWNQAMAPVSGMVGGGASGGGGRGGVIGPSGGIIGGPGGAVSVGGGSSAPGPVGGGGGGTVGMQRQNQGGIW